MIGILIFLSFSLSQQDTGIVSQDYNIDTSIVNDIYDGEFNNEDASENSLSSFLLQLAPFIIALAGIGISAYALYNQRTITQKQIDAETKRKFIDDLIEINKRVNLVIFETFKLSHNILENINNEKELEDFRREINKAINDLSDKSLEFYYWNGTALLFIPKNHREHNNLKRLSRKLSRSFSYYLEFFYSEEIPTIAKEKKLGDILEKRVGYFSDKLENLIEEERENIKHIFKNNNKN